jgi:hypothetical protein
MQNEPIEVTLRVTVVLEELGIPYLRRHLNYHPLALNIV